MKKDLQKKIEGKVNTNKVWRLFKKFDYAFNGLRLAVTNHTSFITHIIIGFIICFLSIIFKISATELMFVLSAIFFVLISELINTAIEESINMFTNEFHRGAMISKDSAAAAVLLASLYATLIGIIVFGPKFYALLKFHQQRYLIMQLVRESFVLLICDRSHHASQPSVKKYHQIR